MEGVGLGESVTCPGLLDRVFYIAIYSRYLLSISKEIAGLQYYNIHI